MRANESALFPTLRGHRSDSPSKNPPPALDVIDRALKREKNTGKDPN